MLASAAPMPRSSPQAAFTLSLVIAPLAALASALGLLVPGLYRDPAWLVSQTRSQDLVTLLAMPAMLWALRSARRGSVRGQLVWLGILGYVGYTYVGAAFAYAFNALFLLYVALFGLSVFTLAFGIGALEAVELAASFDARMRRRAVVSFLALLALTLSALWLGQIVPALFAGTLPDSLARSGGSLKFVFALDLGLVVPLAVLAAVWLWQRRPWGHVLSGMVLIKASTMGLALLSMTAFSVAEGQPAELGLFIPWIALTLGSLGTSAWFLGSCRR